MTSNKQVPVGWPRVEYVLIDLVGENISHAGPNISARAAIRKLGSVDVVRAMPLLRQAVEGGKLYDGSSIPVLTEVLRVKVKLRRCASDLRCAGFPGETSQATLCGARSRLNSVTVLGIDFPQCAPPTGGRALPPCLRKCTAPCCHALWRAYHGSRNGRCVNHDERQGRCQAGLPRRVVDEP